MGCFARLIFVSALLSSSVAAAQSPDDLERARATFAEALVDQEASRFEIALEKFRRVAVVRDTAQVEYRIGMCAEALHRTRAALVAFDHAARLGRGDPSAQDVVAASNAELDSLAKSLGKLDVTVRGASDASVRIDGETITNNETHGVLLEPGDHVVEVTAPRAKTSQSTVTIGRGRRLDLVIDLAGESSSTVVGHARRDLGIVMLGTAVAFAGAAGIALIVRNSTIDAIKTDCPNDVCPVSRHDEIESMRSSANTLAPIAAVLGGVAVASAVLGVVLIALGPERRVTATIGLMTLGVRGVF